jgi:histone demethylase JARID1
MFCLDPPLLAIPKGSWFCHKCMFGNNNYGFDEGEEHSLTSFQERDSAFRKKWFEGHPPPASTWDDPTRAPVGGVQVSEDDVEREFWRLVQSSHATVEVEYGADVHSTTHGRWVEL